MFYTNTVYYKGYNSGTANQKRRIGPGMGVDECGPSKPSLGTPPFQHSDVFTNLEDLLTLSVRHD